MPPRAPSKCLPARPRPPRPAAPQVARRTPGFTGADLANLMNEAAILAARRNLKEISKVGAGAVSCRGGAAGGKCRGGS